MSTNGTAAPNGFERFRGWAEAKISALVGRADAGDVAHDKLHARISKVDTRVQKLERRVAWFAGAGAFAGMVGGFLVKALFKL